MGCGTSSLPKADTPGEFEPDSKHKTPDDQPSRDMVETFKANGTPTPSPQTKVVEKETLESGEMPSPSTYKSDGAAEHDAKEYSTVSQFQPLPESPLPQEKDGSPLEQWQPRNAPALSPGYKLEDEGRKIGGFDPVAFRNANQPKQQAFFSQSGPSTHTPPIDWSAPGSNGNGGYHGGSSMGNSNPPMYNNNNPGSSEQWNRRDYIQSEDIFTTEARPQSFQQQQPQRVEFRDDPAEDPFRAPGGLGHQNNNNNVNGTGAINNEDDALMDAIISELDDF